MTSVLIRGAGLRRGARRADRLRLRAADALGAEAAQLHLIRGLLQRAIDIVDQGWVRDAWFAVDLDGRTHLVTAAEVRLAGEHPVTGACLVGAIVQAGGGPSAARSQPVQRALDLVWHTLREDPERPVRWCPGPPVRALHVRDLTGWNDDPARTPEDVVGLLHASVATTETQRTRCRSELSVVT